MIWVYLGVHFALGGKVTAGPGGEGSGWPGCAGDIRVVFFSQGVNSAFLYLFVDFYKKSYKSKGDGKAKGNDKGKAKDKGKDKGDAKTE